MTVKVDVQDHSYPAGRGWANWMTAGEGEVVTPYGIVDVMRCLPVNDHKGWVNFRFIHDGRVFNRTYGAHYSQLYCVTLAKRFSKEIRER